MGFWDYPVGGISTPSDAWMRELFAAQKAGNEPTDKSKLRLNAGNISKKYSTDELPGHAAWIVGDWKLHRITGGKRGKGAKGGGTKFELYNLVKDRKESNNVIKDEPERAKKMKAALAVWQESVVNSLNGEDY